MIQTSYSDARANFAHYLDKAVDDRETIVVRRRGRPDVAIVAADELASLEETAHVFSSPANARRILDALERAERGEGVRMTVEELREKFGLAAEE